MRTLVASFFISLDGVVEAPDQWQFPYFNDEINDLIGSTTAGNTALLMGRTLYSEWSQYWPAQVGDGEFGDWINGTSKYVLTHRPLEEDVWAGTTVRWLLANNLLDELNLLVHPIVVGKGARLFEGDARIPLKLIENRPLSNGVLHSRYAPA